MSLHVREDRLVLDDDVNNDPDEISACKWELCPAELWFERGGHCVFIDRLGRAIARIHADESVEILPPDAMKGVARRDDAIELQFRFSSTPPKWVQRQVTGYIEKYGLAPELQRRFELKRADKLWDFTPWSPV